MFPALGNFIEDLGPKTQNKRGSLDYYTMNSFCYTWRKTKTFFDTGKIHLRNRRNIWVSKSF